MTLNSSAENSSEEQICDVKSLEAGEVIKARQRDWLVLSKHTDQTTTLQVRALESVDGSTLTLHPNLEITPITRSQITLPDSVKCFSTQSKAALYDDALRLSLSQGSGPFHSPAQMTFEPRAYQLVPLLMALRLEVPRILIADDVGIGKTIEAGLILRELMDRGEVHRFSVLCPPHLVEQWENELLTRFNIQAVAVTSKSIRQLERRLPIAESVFEVYPYTIVSLDYIKARKRQENFARNCPDFILVDEAHTCIGTSHGKQQRYRLLAELADNPQRRIIMLTATPHSGDVEAFKRLLGLLNPELAEMNFDDQNYRIQLARHYVQRRRIDILSTHKEAQDVFPTHETTEWPYELPRNHQSFQDAVLDYCLEMVEQAGSEKRKQRFAFWATLSLMRCVNSSPAAALRSLQNRAESLTDESIEARIFEEESDDGEVVDEEGALPFLNREPSADGEPSADKEPSADREPSANQEPSADQDTTQLDLPTLIDQVKDLMGPGQDHKLDALILILKEHLLDQGFHPVIFCGYVASVEYVCQHLKEIFPKAHIEGITGSLSSTERRETVYQMGQSQDRSRILVATDCLSEGINLQQLFNAVIHYDLSWNPTRHQQREGRVDRFGQVSQHVRSIMLYSAHSPVDGAVLDVILRKAQEIKKATGATVPLPEERGPITDAIYESLKLKRQELLSIDLEADNDLASNYARAENHWRSVLENEKKSRTRFAQRAIKAEEVMSIWTRAQDFMSSSQDVKRFLKESMHLMGAPLEERGQETVAYVSRLPLDVKERLYLQQISDRLKVAFEEPVPFGAFLAHRTHPLIQTLADTLTKAALQSDTFPDLGVSPLGAWLSNHVQKTTIILLLRLRLRVKVMHHKERTLITQEAACVALQDGQIWAEGAKARALLRHAAASNMPSQQRSERIKAARQALPEMRSGPIRELIAQIERRMERDHRSIRDASKGSGKITVKACLPEDVVGLFVLEPVSSGRAH